MEGAVGRLRGVGQAKLVIPYTRGLGSRGEGGSGGGVEGVGEGKWE